MDRLDPNSKQSALELTNIYFPPIGISGTKAAQEDIANVAHTYMHTHTCIHKGRRNKNTSQSLLALSAQDWEGIVVV